MLTKSKKNTIRFLNFLLFAVCILFFGNTGFDISIKTAYPFICLALLVAFSVFSSIHISALAGFICGAFIDSTAAGTYCFNTVTLMLLSVCVSLLSDRFFNKNLKAVTVLCFLTACVYYIAYWLIFINPFFKTGGNMTYILQYGLPSSIYTTVFIFPFYFLYRYWDKLKNE